MITVTRKTSESTITVRLDPSGVTPDYRAQINTPLAFLNHMIEHIVWRSGVGLAVEVKLDRFELAHLVCEDVAVTIGKAVLEHVTDGRGRGVTGYGDGVGIIDEARVTAAISFEGRAGLYFSGAELVPASTEGMNSEDLMTFLEGFVQGANCTLHIDVWRSANGHHIWEAAFRALGIALGRAFEHVPRRTGFTAGVAGAISFDVRKDERAL